MPVQTELMRQARSSGLALFINIFLGLMTAVFVILQAFLLSSIINDVFLNHQTLGQVTPSIISLVITILGRSLLVVGMDVSAKSIAVRVKTNLRAMLIQKTSQLGPVYAAGARRGELIHTTFEGVEALDAYFSQYLPQVVLAALIPLAILVAVFPKEPISGTILLFTAPLIPVFMALIGWMTESRSKRQWSLLTQLSTRFYDALQGLDVLKQLNRELDQESSIAAADKQFRQATLSVLKYTFLSAMVLEFIATISTAIVAVEIGLRLLYGQMAFQQALFILILAPEFYLPLRQLGIRYHAAMNGIQAATDIYKILGIKGELTEHAMVGDLQKSEPHESVDGGSLFPIRFEQVSASYPGQSEPVLREISFVLEQGKHYALVGRSGAGKTTLVNLLLRFLTPSQGQIRVSSTPLQSIPVEDWYQQIAWVPQNPYIFNGSILSNVCLGDEIDEPRLENSLKAAELWDWVQGLPDGWNTKTGDRAGLVSAGQAQRIAIARAHYKDSPLLIMDEPTSAVDPVLERQLMSATSRLRMGRTSITIAHRLPTIMNCDRIFVIDDQCIVEEGNHQDLVMDGGRYAQMVKRYIGG